MIDEKGRLFGKINIIDLLVILVIAAALCFAVFRYVLPDRNSGKAVQKELVLYCHDTPRFTAEQIEKGARVWDQGYDVETVTDASGKTHLVENDWLVSVTLVLDAEGVPDEFGIRIGGSLYASGHTMTVFAGDAKLYLKVQEIR